MLYLSFLFSPLITIVHLLGQQAIYKVSLHHSCFLNDVAMVESFHGGVFFSHLTHFLWCIVRLHGVDLHNRIVMQVNWEDEKSCFQTISAALGNFYAMHPPLLPNPYGENGLEFYKKTKHMDNCMDIANNDSIGTSFIISYGQVLICFYKIDF